MYIKNKESNERVKLEKRRISNCKSISELKELFITELKEDYEDLLKIFENYDFPSPTIAINVNNIVFEILDIVYKNDNEITL